LTSSREMVPSFDWANFFGGLDRVNAQGGGGAGGGGAASSSPAPPNKPPRKSSRENSDSRKETSNPSAEDLPLPPGWTLENHNGKSLYVNHEAKTYSWVHPALSDK
jgi:hypothetical protein